MGIPLSNQRKKKGQRLLVLIMHIATLLIHNDSDALTELASSAARRQVVRLEGRLDVTSGTNGPASLAMLMKVLA